MRTPFLTKSRFKLALDCVTKLYYTKKKDEYADQSLDDSFLEALADGGFQVGELAKYYFSDDPENITIRSLNEEEAVRETNNRLSATGRVVIAEAAFLFKNLFVRVDILVKDNDAISIYEVKSKSYSSEEEFLTQKKDRVLSEWVDYLYDIAFQKFVVENSLGNNVRAHLLLVDKLATASVDGLNQLFKINKNGDRRVVPEEGITRNTLGEKILAEINVDSVCEKIRNNFFVPTDLAGDISFEDFIWRCAQAYENDEQVFSTISSRCKNCEFQTTSEDSENLKSGFMECWKKETGLSEKELQQPLVIELWGGPKKLLQQKKYLLRDIDEIDIIPHDTKEGVGLSAHERRMEQVNRVKKNTLESYFDADGFHREMKKWKFPLHMIDFETSMAAIPFHKGLHPYEGIAFQFSHHTIDSDWKIRHATQFLSFEKGKFPNYDFVRALKNALSNDDGTVFRYHNHENTYLNMIYNQLGSDPNAPRDKEELMDFIRSITHSASWDGGNRDMVDMYKLVLSYYFPPRAKGSNSLKDILPALIFESDFLKEKYGKPGVYGKGKEVASLNFDDHVWIREEKNWNPYETLLNVFDDYDRKTLDSLVKDFESKPIADGGTAMTAYNRLQYSDIPVDQREHIRDSLYRYCELDTMAMVMLVEGWKNR